MRVAEWRHHIPALKIHDRVDARRAPLPERFADDVHLPLGKARPIEPPAVAVLGDALRREWIDSRLLRGAAGHRAQRGDEPTMAGAHFVLSRSAARFAAALRGSRRAGSRSSSLAAAMSPRCSRMDASQLWAAPSNATCAPSRARYARSACSP